MNERMNWAGSFRAPVSRIVSLADSLRTHKSSHGGCRQAF